ncbi:hypothetical protein EDB92DRAFT_1297163 [Lactarius akahatsu]|uniref:Uncharacterized protein n=1 Tax=Lactarius akahatsu TaxID=416441 RepID=A0AAD4QAZ9_9AGAM|nr:hypothetical protein EDB92DRAFT_1297163 [Lactarius akahatsu]
MYQLHSASVASLFQFFSLASQLATIVHVCIWHSSKGILRRVLTQVYAGKLACLLLTLSTLLQKSCKIKSNDFARVRSRETRWRYTKSHRGTSYGRTTQYNQLYSAKGNAQTSHCRTPIAEQRPKVHLNPTREEAGW